MSLQEIVVEGTLKPDGTLELGQKPNLAEYILRFPQHAQRLHRQHEQHRAPAAGGVFGVQGSGIGPDAGHRTSDTPPAAHPRRA